MAANLINSPVTSWATLAHQRRTRLSRLTSNPSSLPPYPSHLTEHYDISAHTYSPNHRWVPVPSNYANVALTPLSQFCYDAFSPHLINWAMAAQEHYSLLTNLGIQPTLTLLVQQRRRHLEHVVRSTTTSISWLYGVNLSPMTRCHQSGTDEWNLSEFFLPKKAQHAAVWWVVMHWRRIFAVCARRRRGWGGRICSIVQAARQLNGLCTG